MSTLIRPALFATALALLSLVGTAGATQPIDFVRVTQSGSDGDVATSAEKSSVAVNTATGARLVVFQALNPANGADIYGRLIAPDGSALGDQFRISSVGADGLPDSGASNAIVSDVVYNPAANEYLVAWYGDDPDYGLADDEHEVYARRVSAAGAVIGVEVRVSDLGPDGDATYQARDPRVAYNSQVNEYLVVWRGDDNSAPLVDEENEIFGQRLSGTSAAEIGGDFRISDLGPDGDPLFDAGQPDVVFNATANEYLVVWRGDDNTGALIDEETEIFVQRLAADGTEIGGDTRISDMGPDGVADYDAESPRAAYNPRGDQYLVVWVGDDDVVGDDELEVWGQRLSGTASQLGADFRISDMGPDGVPAYGALSSEVAYNSTADEYMVAWQGDDGTAPLVLGEHEIFARRITPAGGRVGPDTRISRMGPDSNPNYDAARPSLAFDPVSNEYAISWHADDNTGALLDDETEIYLSRTKGGAHLVGHGDPKAVCASPEPISGSGGGGKLELSVLQLKINQRIGAAAVRRANAIEKWLGDGIVSRDICGGGLGHRDMHSGLAVVAGALRSAPLAPTPRAVKIPAVEPDPSANFSLTTSQLKINQRIYAAAVRRANALKIRIEGKLTGGDIVDRSLTDDRLTQNLWATASTAPASPIAASTTNVQKNNSTPANFQLTVRQLQINQRIAAAAVRRTNALRTQLATGLTGANFVDGTISVSDMAP